MGNKTYGKALRAFVNTRTEDERLALGLELLREARDEANEKGLIGWAADIGEYVIALESGRSLNRPL